MGAEAVQTPLKYVLSQGLADVLLRLGAVAGFFRFSRGSPTVLCFSSFGSSGDGGGLGTQVRDAAHALFP